MLELDQRLLADIAEFRERVFTDPVEVLDPEDIHHEFVSGNHGRKLDFDKIDTDSDFYIDWVSIYARTIRARYQDRLPDAVVGIANGANRLAKSIAGLLGKGVVGLTTEKIDAKAVQLDEEALEIIESGNIRFALTVEDVGTTGGTTVSAIRGLRAAGVRRIESINGFQRNLILPKLVEVRIPHSAVILDPLPMFTPEECANNEAGYCFKRIELVTHGK